MMCWDFLHYLFLVFSRSLTCSGPELFKVNVGNVGKCRLAGNAIILEEGHIRSGYKSTEHPC